MDICGDSNDTKAFLDMLVTGSMSSDLLIRDTCIHAVYDWGEIFEEDLFVALKTLAKKSKSRSVKHRVRQFLNEMNEDNFCMDVSIELCLNSDSPLLRRKAFRALRGLRFFRDHLVSCAIHLPLDPVQCALYLQAAAETSGAPHPRLRERLVNFQRTTKDPEVKAAAAVLIERYGPQGSQGTP